MPQRGPLQWIAGEGWLVLLGGGDWRHGATEAVDAHVLNRANLDRPMVVLLSEGSEEQANGVLEHYTALGGAGGEAYSLERLTRRDLAAPEFLALLSEAGLLYLGGERPARLTQALHNTEALKRIVLGFASLQGLIIVGAGGAAAALGARVAEGATPGLSFVPNAIIAPHFVRTEEADALRSLLREYPGYLGLGIPDSVALALGPQEEVETWGLGEVTAIVQKQD